MRHRSVFHLPISKYSDANADKSGTGDGRLDPAIPADKASEIEPIGEEYAWVGRRDQQLIVNRLVGKLVGVMSQWARAKAEVEIAEAELAAAKLAADHAEEQHHKATGSHAPSTFRRWVSDVLFSVIAIIGELELNKMAFDILRQAGIETYTMALALTTVMVVAGHLIGRAAKLGHRIIACALALINGGALVGIAFVRSRFMEQAHCGLGMGGFLTFASFNIALVAVAAVLSYYHHNPLLDDVFRSRIRATKALRALKNAEVALATADAQGQALYAAAQAESLWVAAEVYRLLAVYRVAAARTRSDRTLDRYHASHGRYPAMPTPNSLAQSAWTDCMRSVADTPLVPVAVSPTTTLPAYPRRHARRQARPKKRAGLVRHSRFN